MRTFLGVFAVAAIALCASNAFAQDLAIDVEQSFTAHPERFALPSPDATQVAIAPAQAVAQAANETPPNGEAARQEPARQQGDGETTWETQKNEKDEAAH